MVNPQIDSRWKLSQWSTGKLTWAVTVRDRYPASDQAKGRMAFDVKVLKVISDAGPFVVSSQNQEGILWEAGSKQTITWEVAQTDQAPIDTKFVSYFYLQTEEKPFEKGCLLQLPTMGRRWLPSPEALALNGSGSKLHLTILFILL